MRRGQINHTAPFDNMDAFWEYIKAQGTQTARIWDRLPDDVQEQVRNISPTLTANLDALAWANRCGVRVERD